MKALILAAGLGTRLLPLTASIPKALIPLNGMPLLEIAIRKLSAAGFDEIIINVHHFAEKVIDFLSKAALPGVTLAISDETEELLDTGGAILHARSFLEGKEPFLVHNVDVISDIDLNELARVHCSERNIVTLAVSNRNSNRYFLFNEEGKLCGWRDTILQTTRWATRPDKPVRQLAFSGIHMISPDIFSLFTEQRRFSIIDAYLRLAAQWQIGSFVHSPKSWFDVGKPDQITRASVFLASQPHYLK